MQEPQPILFKKIFSWNAPERAWSEKTRAWYVLYSFFFVVLIAIVAILGQTFLILAIIAFIFLWFTQASIPPQIREHSITTIGIKTFEKMFKWSSIKHFWFSSKEGYNYLNLDLVENDPANENLKRISLIIDPTNEFEIFNTLINYIDYGDTKEIDYNILTRLLQGKHKDISLFLPENLYTQEQYIEITDESATQSPKKKKSKK